MPVKINGNVSGLKPRQKQLLEKLYERKTALDKVLSEELAKSMCFISREIGRQVGVLVDRRGRVADVFVGDAKGLEISDFGRYRAGQSRLRALRFIHTHLSAEGFNADDLTDLALLRFDLIAALETTPEGLPGHIHIAHLLPFRKDDKIYEIMPPVYFYNLRLRFDRFIDALEAEMNESAHLTTDDKSKRAILVHVTTRNDSASADSMAELVSLAESANIKVLDTVIQKRREIDPRFVMGAGKIKELLIRTMELEANLIVFDGELSGSQMKAVSDAAEIDVIDRTQLILDIFAQRAQSREGKIQVELAQMKYSLPRFVMKDDFLSRITGGIRSKGPGETKMEILKRRVRDRIVFLEKEIQSIVKSREERRKKREKNALPVISIVGYTNAGKSTLLNALTSSSTFVEDKFFATLDTASRKLRLPREREIIVTDTVGFIRNIPVDLLAAFRATLEEMRDSSVLIHLFDMSSPFYKDHIESVESILCELALDNIPLILVGNKCEALDEEGRRLIEEQTNAISISAKNKINFNQLLEKIAQELETKLKFPRFD